MIFSAPGPILVDVYLKAFNINQLTVFDKTKLESLSWSDLNG
jgi:hypothetical protein